jgi:hypothetical protein
MAEETEGEVIGTEAQEGQGSPYILMLTHKSLASCFRPGFFNWIGQGVVQPRPERPPFQVPQAPGIPVPPHVSLQPEVPENDGWQEIVHPTVSQHRGWPNLSLPAPRLLTPLSKLPPTHQCSPLMLEKG